MKTLARDQQRRDILLGIAGGEYFGGIERYTGLQLAQLQALVAENFIDLKDAQNSAPSAEEFLAFMEGFPRFTAHGYAVDKSRHDYGMMIEGLDLAYPPTSEESVAFVKMFRHADEFVFDASGLHCWYD